MTYALTCGLWLPWMLTRIELLEILGFVGLFAPAVACIVIARVAGPGRTRGHVWARRAVFLVGWVLITGVFLLNANRGSDGLSAAQVVVFALIALIPAFVLASGFSDNPSVRARLQTLVRPSGSVSWYVLALLLIPALRLLSLTINRLLGWGAIANPDPTPLSWALAGSVVTSFLYTAIAAGGINEETGWTGFALPGLQRQHSPLVATVVLWFFWILWHMPFHFAGLWNPELDSLLRALVGTFFGRFIFTWLYNRSAGGTWTAILFHASANVCFEFLPVTPVQFTLEAAVASAVVVGNRMWRRLPSHLPVAAERHDGLPAASGMVGSHSRCEGV